MFRIVVFIIGLLLLVQPTTAQQPYNQTSATAQQHGDGLFYLVLGGDQAEVNAICAYGNCAQGFASLFDALNYWGLLLSKRYNIALAPLPVYTAQAVPPVTLLDFPGRKE